MRRGCAAAAMALTMAMGIGACGDDDGGSQPAQAGGAPAVEEVTVGVVLKNLAAPFWAQVKQGIDGESLPGVKVELAAATSEVDVAGQINQIENAITKGVDALVVAPTVPNELIPALNRAAAEDIPIVLLDTDIPKFSGKTAYVGTNNIEAGRIAGDYINKVLGGKGKLGILVSAPGVTSVDDRENGVKERLDAGVQVLNGGVTQCVRDKGVTSAEDLLTAHPDVKAIFTSCGDPMKGALRAIKAAGKDGKLLTVGFDADTETVKEIQSGELDALVTQFPIRMGALGLKAAVDAARGKKVPSTIDSGAKLITKDNVASVADSVG